MTGPVASVNDFIETGDILMLEQVLACCYIAIVELTNTKSMLYQ